jgi:hypothetical protein
VGGDRDPINRVRARGRGSQALLADAVVAAVCLNIAVLARYFAAYGAATTAPIRFFKQPASEKLTYVVTVRLP